MGVLCCPLLVLGMGVELTKGLPCPRPALLRRARLSSGLLLLTTLMSLHLIWSPEPWLSFKNSLALVTPLSLHHLRSHMEACLYTHKAKFSQTNSKMTFFLASTINNAARK